MSSPSSVGSTSGRRARFHDNPVNGVRHIPSRTPSPPSPTSSTSSDEGPPTPPFYAQSLTLPTPIPSPRNSPARPLASLSHAHARSPHHRPTALPLPAHNPQVYTPSPPQHSPQLQLHPSPSYTTPSPVLKGLHLHPAFGRLNWDPLTNEPPAVHPSELGQPAFTGRLPVSEPVLTTRAMPWCIAVHAPNPAYALTVADVLNALHTSLRTPVTKDEWNAMKPYHREIRAAFEKRCASRPGERDKGVRRVDYLKGEIVQGLSVILTAEDGNLNIDLGPRSTVGSVRGR